MRADSVSGLSRSDCWTPLEASIPALLLGEDDGSSRAYERLRNRCASVRRIAHCIRNQGSSAWLALSWQC